MQWSFCDAPNYNSKAWLDDGWMSFDWQQQMPLGANLNQRTLASLNAVTASDQKSAQMLINQSLIILHIHYLLQMEVKTLMKRLKLPLSAWVILMYYASAHIVL